MVARRGGSAEGSHPGALPPQGILFLETFGHFSTGVETPGVTNHESVLWSLFLARAEMMGWSTPAWSSSEITRLREHGVRWSVHEAELDASGDSSRMGWVQVGVEAGIPAVIVLPAMIQCVDDALRRFGATELSALQVTACHLQSGPESHTSDLVSWVSWFTTSRGPEVEALVTTDDRLFRSRSNTELLKSLQRIGSEPFQFGPLVTASRDQAIRIPVEAPMDVALSSSGRGISVKLPEWSATGAAWVLAFIIETALADGTSTEDFAVRLTRVQ